jgi:protein-S-isoprenylcysteine O-methyltransferase Ste14
MAEQEDFVNERKGLIDAARESARTFDKAVLTFGAAVFGFSIAFLKDIAPRPAPDTLKWLGAAWLLFALGLLLIMLSFLFSHRACLLEIDNLDRESPMKNRWSTITDCCNFLCVVLLFLGLLCWSVFAFQNLGREGNVTAQSQHQTPQSEPRK